jgi:molybdenum cofactor synthesis domain-containing protein
MSAPSKITTACLIVIGNEILSGRTQDANVAYTAKWLNERGVRLTEARVIPDIEATIVATVNECRRAFDYVFTTGGIGPTHDDITAGSIAKAFGVPLVRREEAVELMRKFYGDANLTEARLRMACTPEGAEFIENPISRAPGFRMENVFVLAGVPLIMRAMLDSLGHLITGGEPVRSRAVWAHTPESVVAKGIEEIQNRHEGVDIGSYPFYRDGRTGTTLIARSTNSATLDVVQAELMDVIRSVGGEPHVGDATDLKTPR